MGIIHFSEGSQGMLLNIGVTSGMQLERILKLSKIVQESELDSIWVGDDISDTHDVFTVASLVLLRNSRLKVSIGITSPKIRNISTIARASVSLSEIGAAGRFRLGLGVGGLQDLERFGITIKHPENLLRDATTLLRSTWTGEKVNFESDDFSLKNYRGRYGPGQDLPIFFGVRGPKLLQLAGEIADGVILSGPRKYLEKAVAIVRKGLEKRNSERNFCYVVWIPTILTEEPGDLDLVRRTAAIVLMDTPRKVLEMAELNRGDIENIARTYSIHGLSKASELVTKDVLDEIAVWGDAEQVCSDLESLKKFQIDESVFGPPYGANPERALTKLTRAWRKFA
jgi:5,10-methylenetetrahydromethanopterin reductase